MAEDRQLWAALALGPVQRPRPEREIIIMRGPCNPVDANDGPIEVKRRTWQNSDIHGTQKERGLLCFDEVI